MNDLGRHAFAVLALVSSAACRDDGSNDAAGCSAAGQHWVTAWEAPPSDATMPFDAGLRPWLTGGNQTFRAILSPLGAGSVVRLRFSNRFGNDRLTFGRVTIARRTSGAGIDPASVVALQFGGRADVAIPAGSDIVSDAVDFAFEDFDDIVVSMNALDTGAFETHHFMARQYSYATLPTAGDHVDDATGIAFLQSATIRPFVVGLETLSDAGTSTIVTVGDSLTDGAQAPATVVPEVPGTIDRNMRYPDFLRRRLIADGRSVFVANAGIAGNLVLQDGSAPNAGPSLVSRIDADVLSRSGVTDVLLWEGINDIGSISGLTAETLTAGYVQVIDRLHESGRRVLQATVTPASSTNADEEALRQQVNDWIRTRSPADAVVDFDAAVRDAGRPDRIDARYDGGDGVHLNAAGYERVAGEVDLGRIGGCYNSGVTGE